MGLQLNPRTQIRFWDENGILYNTAGGGWFVPLDAMVTHSISKHLLFAVGASKQVVQTFRSFDWSIYGKISLRFWELTRDEVDNKKPPEGGFCIKAGKFKPLLYYPLPRTQRFS